VFADEVVECWVWVRGHGNVPRIFVDQVFFAVFMVTRNLQNFSVLWIFFKNLRILLFTITS
jgi:hypothetical protein